MDIKKYRIVDLTILLIVGVATELMGSLLINAMMPWVVPVFTSAIIILIVAMVRWGAIGMILAPILALASYIGALFIMPNKGDGIEQMPVSYLVNLAFLLPTLALYPFIKKYNYEEMFNTGGKRVLCIFAVYILGSILGGLMFTLHSLNFILSIGTLLVQQSMSLVITVIFMEMLTRQGTLVNVKKKFLREREEAQLDQQYYDSKRRE